MSVLINEKLHSHRLKWRWPLSASGDLSIGTLAVLSTVWWAVAALQPISPLFCRHRNRYWQTAHHCRAAGFMDATPGQHLAASPTRIVLALLAAVVIIFRRDRHGAGPTVRGIPDPIIELFWSSAPPSFICRCRSGLVLAKTRRSYFDSF